MKKSKLVSACLVFLMTVVLFAGSLGISAFAAEETVDYSTMVTDEIVAKGGVMQYSSITAQFLHGNFDGNSLQPFKKWDGGGTGTPNDVLIYPDSASTAEQGTNVLWRWQWRATADDVTVLKITAKENMKIDIVHRENVTDQWATHSAFRFIAENEDKIRLTLRRLDVASTMTVDDIKTTVHLAKNDTLYIVYAIMTGEPGTATATYFPVFKIDTSAYDSSKRAQFDQVSALQKIKSDKEKELNDKYTQLVGDGSVYSSDHAMELEEIVNETVGKFADLSTEDELNAVYNEAITKMEAVPTKAEEEAELQAFKDEQKKELSSAVSRENYSSANWKTIQDYISDANKKIDEAKSSAAVSTAVAQAKAKIDKVQMKQPSSVMPWVICGVVVLAVIIVAVVVVVIVLRKNKGNAKKNQA